MNSYEAGQHMVPQPPMAEADQDTLRALAVAANAAPGIRNVYQSLERLWNEISGGAPIMFFANTVPAQAVYNQDPFGMQTFTGQDRADAPKYDYLLDQLEASGHRHRQ